MFLINTATIKKIFKCFPRALINHNGEMIINPSRNTYFNLFDLPSEEIIQYKILENLSREASKGITWQSRKYHFDGICAYFGRKFTQEEMDLIYQKLGNGINRILCEKYIESGFDIKVLEEEE